MSILRHSRSERGFTLIELLVVIVIIGILAAIAIPVFTSQRGRSNDASTTTDVRNLVTAAETYLADPNNKSIDLSPTTIGDVKTTVGTKWGVEGKANGYCVVAYNAAGKKYNAPANVLTYDSAAGGLTKTGGSCDGEVAADSGVGALVVGGGAPVVPAMNLTATNATGAAGTVQKYDVTVAGNYEIKTWGASGTNTGKGAYASGIVALTSGTTLNVIVGQAGFVNNGRTSGGGGTFVVDTKNTASLADDVALVVAGGGSDDPGQVTTSGSNPSSGFGNAAGTNGSAGYTNQAYCLSGSGGGFFTSANGPSYSCVGSGGRGYRDGSFGGAGTTDSTAGPAGGFGGGGGGGGSYTGGGGGYSGGSSGGGGGSYVLPTATDTVINNTTLTNIGAGKVTITKVG